MAKNQNGPWISSFTLTAPDHSIASVQIVSANGDGTYTTSFIITGDHTYAEAGAYLVSVTVSDWVPAVFRVTLKVPTPLVSVLSTGRT